MNKIVGTCDFLFITLDTLRFDVAQQAFATGKTPNLASWIGKQGWERRHSPANFTYAAHHAFFAGFLPTPIDRVNQVRLFATEFIGSETTGTTTRVFASANIIDGFGDCGYETHCIGGVGFFNKKNPLGNVLPGMFHHSYWDESLGVARKESTENQFGLASKIIDRSEPSQRLFLFVNVSALHQPNCHYIQGATHDSIKTQSAALAYVDSVLGRFFDSLHQTQRSWMAIICSDHGTAYGEQGRVGHRWNHPVIGDVPYTDFMIN